MLVGIMRAAEIPRCIVAGRGGAALAKGEVVLARAPRVGMARHGGNQLGQWLFGCSPESTLARLNYQRETDLHNLIGPLSPLARAMMPALTLFADARAARAGRSLEPPIPNSQSSILNCPRQFLM